MALTHLLKITEKRNISHVLPQPVIYYDGRNTGYSNKTVKSTRDVYFRAVGL